MSAASFGGYFTRVAVPDVEDVPARFAIAINVRLDNLSARKRAADALTDRLRTLATVARAFSEATTTVIVRHGVLESKLAFLQKPVTPDTLRTKVRQILDERKETRA